MPRAYAKEFSITQEYREQRKPFFMDKVHPDINGCWIWQGKLNEWGYGCFGIGRRSVGAHRAAWLLFKGDIPNGQVVCHRCDVPACANPNHLFIGTHLENVRDMLAKGRDNYRKRQELCGAGFHPMKGKNVIMRQRKLKSGKLSPSRECLACHCERSKAWAKKKRREAA